MYGKHHTIESRKKISESNIGKVMPPHTEEWKKYMSNIMVGRIISDNWRKKISQSEKGKIVSEESKKKISESRKGKYGGEKHPNAKLTWEIVNNIREDFGLGLRQTDLVKKYDLSKSLIRDVVTFKSWKNNDKN